MTPLSPGLQKFMSCRATHTTTNRIKKNMPNLELGIVWKIFNRLIID